MPTLKSNHDETIPAAQDVAIEFRVTRPGSPRRRLKLVGPKYTFGSGPECSVRLDDATVRPMHASLVRNSKGEVVLRAAGVAIPVNGVAKTESELFCGDYFQLGAYEFELLTDLRSQEQTATAGKSKAPATQAENSVAEEPAAEKPAANSSRVVPRRRLSFADSMHVITEFNNQPPPTSNPRSAESLADPPLADPPVLDGPSAELDFSDESAEPVEPEPVEPEPVEPVAEKSELAVGTADDNPLPHRLLNPDQVLDARRAGVDLLEQQQAILANERRWQERSRRQQERFRQREQRAKAQVEALRQAQELAEQRARQAEDTVHGLRNQLAELSGRVSAMAGSMVPGIEMRLEQQQQDTEVANRQVLGLAETLRKRLDFVQAALDSVQQENREIRLQTVANQTRQEEVAADAEMLEQSLQQLADQYAAGRSRDEAAINEVRGNVQRSTERLSQLGGELEETRQAGHGLSALVQQLRSSLQNLQTDSERYATISQIETLQREQRDSDQRLSRLADEYDMQSQQLQAECDELRQRLEATEDSAQQAINAVGNLKQTMHQVVPADPFDVADPFASAPANNSAPANTSQRNLTAAGLLATESHVVETPVAETPVAETPVVETPAAETPPAETPPAETPPAETPPAETPPAETPAAEMNSAEMNPAEFPFAETVLTQPPSPLVASEPALPTVDQADQREDVSVSQSQFFTSLQDELEGTSGHDVTASHNAAADHDVSTARDMTADHGDEASISMSAFHLPIDQTAQWEEQHDVDDSPLSDHSEWLDDDPFSQLDQSGESSATSLGADFLQPTAAEPTAAEPALAEEMPTEQVAVEGITTQPAPTEVAHETPDSYLDGATYAIDMEPKDLANAAEAIDAIDRASLDPSGLLASFGIQPQAQQIDGADQQDAERASAEREDAERAQVPGSTAAEILARMGLAVETDELAELNSPPAAAEQPVDEAWPEQELPEQQAPEQSLSEQVLSQQVLSEQVLSEQVLSEQVFGEQTFAEQPAEPPAERAYAAEPAYTAEPAAAANEEEESIEDYMNRLLRRVQGVSSDEAGGSTPRPAASSSPAPASSSPSSAAASPATATDNHGATSVVGRDSGASMSAASGEAASFSSHGSPATTAGELGSGLASSPQSLSPQELSQQPLSPESPYVPRSNAPERSGNLAAMRELANSSARSAIATSARRRMANEALFKFAIFGLGVLAGLATLVGTDFAIGRWLIVALCCFALSGFFLYEALNLRKRLQASAPASTPAAAAEPSPASDLATAPAAFAAPTAGPTAGPAAGPNPDAAAPL
ncbi:hypothetical protein SH139x_004458 [Planctomycetaceae bacterium SH139]